MKWTLLYRAGAFGLNRLIASLLFGVRPTDIPIFADVIATMIVVAAVASLLPAWRASRLDPVAAVRAELTGMASHTLLGS